MRIRKLALVAVAAAVALLVPVLLAVTAGGARSGPHVARGRLVRAQRLVTPEHIIATLYAYPGLSSWGKVISSAPTVSAAIVDMCAADNTGSGCDQTPWDEQPPAAWTTQIRALQAAGIVPLIYIATNYGNTGGGRDFSLATVKREVSDALRWYGKDIGFMFDEAATSCSLEASYYRPLYQYATQRIAAADFVELNPGTVGPGMACSLHASDVLQVFEGPESGFQGTTFPAWMRGYGASRFAATISAGTSAQLSDDVSAAAADGIGNVYVDDEAEPPNYATLPAFWSAEVSGAAAEHCGRSARVTASGVTASGVTGAAAARPASRARRHRAC